MSLLRPGVIHTRYPIQANVSYITLAMQMKILGKLKLHTSVVLIVCHCPFIQSNPQACKAHKSYQAFLQDFKADIQCYVRSDS